MKRQHAIISKFTLRDPQGKIIHAARVAAAKEDISINEWVLRVIRRANERHLTPSTT